MALGQNSVWCVLRIRGTIPAPEVEVDPTDRRRALQFRSEGHAHRWIMDNASDEARSEYWIIKIPG